MKKLIFILTVIVLNACNNNAKTEVSTGAFGAKFETTNTKSLPDALIEFNNGKDTTYTISGTIENVCQHKGCWISLKNGADEFYINNSETFTMPKTSKGKKATAIGKFLKDNKGEVSFETTGVIIE